jgi:hypothetical protein
VLPAPPFFAGTAAARSLVEQLGPVTLVNLAALAGSLFPRATMPAVVLFARARPGPKDEVSVVTVPWSPTFDRSSSFAISPQDIGSLSVRAWNQDPTRLKAVAFGLGRDIRLLDRLRDTHPSLGAWLISINATMRDGLTFGTEANRVRDARFLRGLELLTSKVVARLQVPQDLPTFELDTIQWPRRRGNFVAPLLLVKEFFRESARPVAAIAQRDIVFTDAYFGAAIDRRYEEEARIAAAILSSSLAGWFFLLTAAEFGVWKQRLMKRDVVALPIPDLSALARTASGERLAELSMHAQPLEAIELWEELDDAVFGLYGLSDIERLVVRDGFGRAEREWEQKRSNASEPAGEETDLQQYASVFASGVDAWLRATSERGIKAEIIRVPVTSPIRVVRFVLGPRDGEPAVATVVPNEPLAEILDGIGQRLSVQLSRYLVGQRELRVHGANEVVVIKPASRRFWTPANAVRDSDAVVAEGAQGPSR